VFSSKGRNTVVYLGHAQGTLRLGVYADLVYWSDDEGISTDRAFVKFVTSLPPRVDEIVLFGRIAPEKGRRPYSIPPEVRVVRLPHYSSVFAVKELVRSLPRSVRAFSRALDAVDAVWIFGPAPLALVFALIAQRRRKPMFLGVRQDYTQYIKSRLPDRRWIWAVAVAKALDVAFRIIARRAATVTVGQDLARRYRSGRAAVLPIGLSLVDRGDVVTPEQALSRRWDGELRLLTVGRLDPEKNPLLLAEIAARLRNDGSRWRMIVAGEGPLADRLEHELRRRGLASSVELLGYVPNGPALWSLYRSSHAFVHVSLTEGLPQVLFEALAAGLPVVATSVGGVADALGNGRRGLLVPPADAEAAAAALDRLASEPDLRERLVLAALEFMAGETVDIQQDRVIAFFREQLKTDS
jgi:glycosyltransferase involved in cell wall biosynthesis